MERLGQKRTKYYKDNPEAMARRNGYRRLRERMAGGRRQFYALDSDARRALNKKAIEMYDLGADLVTAHVAEKIVREGFVYVIWNPAWPAHVKIGRAFDPESRLNSYQTSSPDRDYELKYAVYFSDCRRAEELIHDTLADYRAEGEWFRILPSTAEHILDEIGGYI